MAEAVDQAREERELTKAALSARLEHFEGRVRAELDWKARLRKDGPRYAVMGALALTLVVGGLLLQRARSGSEEGLEDPLDGEVASLDDVAQQLRELRKQVAKGRKRSGAPMVQKLLLRAATAAGSAAGNVVARQAIQRFTPPTGGQGEPAVAWE